MNPSSGPPDIEVTPGVITKQIRSVIFPLLKERGFQKVTQTFSNAYPNENVVHHLHIGRFSPYYRRVTGVPRYSMYAKLITFYPFTLSPQFNSHWAGKADGRIEVRANVHFDATLSQTLPCTLEQPEARPPQPNDIWMMLEQTPGYSQRVVQAIGDEFTRNFDAYHMELRDVGATLDLLIANGRECAELLRRSDYRDQQGRLQDINTILKMVEEDDSTCAELLRAGNFRDRSGQQQSPSDFRQRYSNILEPLERKRYELILLIARHLGRDDVFEAYAKEAVDKFTYVNAVRYGHIDWVNSKTR